jgi:hypothetical protein
MYCVCSLHYCSVIDSEEFQIHSKCEIERLVIHFTIRYSSKFTGTVILFI